MNTDFKDKVLEKARQEFLTSKKLPNNLYLFTKDNNLSEMMSFNESKEDREATLNALKETIKSGEITAIIYLSECYYNRVLDEASIKKQGLNLLYIDKAESKLSIIPCDINGFKLSEEINITNYLKEDSKFAMLFK